MSKIKIAYICQLSNKEIHNHLPLRLDFFTKLMYIKNHTPLNTDVADVAVWNTNAINEFKKYTDKYEIHVISPYPHLSVKRYDYVDDGIFYHFFRNNDDHLFRIVARRLLKRDPEYKRNRKVIKNVLIGITPDIVHIIGAENPQYALSALDVTTSIPVLAQLQTLLNDENFRKNYKEDANLYRIRAEYEKRILERADYIGTSVISFTEIIKNTPSIKAPVLRTILLLAEDINCTPSNKCYDFVYFAADISKAADYAIEAFILASQKHPGITLDVIGGYSTTYKKALVQRLQEYNLEDKVFFEGKLPTHDDVLTKIRESRYALLPLKIDLVSGTIREAMANGLPVITTITPGTPKINKDRETILLSEKGDHHALADNMCKLIEDSKLCDSLVSNGFAYMKSLLSNGDRMSLLIEIYSAILNNWNNGEEIREELLTIKEGG